MAQVQARPAPQSQPAVPSRPRSSESRRNFLDRTQGTAKQFQSTRSRHMFASSDKLSKLHIECKSEFAAIVKHVRYKDTTKAVH